MVIADVAEAPVAATACPNCGSRNVEESIPLFGGIRRECIDCLSFWDVEPVR